MNSADILFVGMSVKVVISTTEEVEDPWTIGCSGCMFKRKKFAVTEHSCRKCGDMKGAICGALRYEKYIHYEQLDREVTPEESENNLEKLQIQLRLEQL